MLRLIRRPDRLSDVRFCDSCAEVSTAAERSRRHRDRVLARAQSQLLPR